MFKRYRHLMLPSFVLTSFLFPASALADDLPKESYLIAHSAIKKENTMKNEDTVDHLKSLVHYEIDHSFLLEQAAHNLKDAAIIKKIESYRDEVEDNIKQLSSAIEKLDGEAPDHSRDFTGFFMQGYAALRGIPSDYGVLQALDTNEKLILKSYDKALRLDLPVEAKDVVQKVYEKDKEISRSVNKQAEMLK